MTKLSSQPVIRLRGVRQNNLKQIDLDLPLGRLLVITGLSGSGKSSLAFDTLFAEGQRRYIETFSPYARQFFDRMDKPQANHIEGIPPAIAIEQRNTVRTTRSTVGTMTEICDYIKILWPHLARLYCRQCGQPVRKDPPGQIWHTMAHEGNLEVLITFDLPLSEKLSLADSLALIAKQGYQRLLIEGAMVRLEEAAAHLGTKKSLKLTVIQDRLKLSNSHRARFVEGCEQAYHFGKGRLAIYPILASTSGQLAASSAPDVTPVNPQTVIGPPKYFSHRLHCANCNLEYREPAAALFSFNHPLGACPACHGFGRIITIDYHLALPDRSKTLAQGVVKPWQSGLSAECQDDLVKFCRLRHVPLNVPFAQLPPSQQDWVLNGDPGYGTDKQHEWPHAWYGIKGYFRWLESRSYKMHVRVLLSRYRAYRTCPDCRGQRFQPEALLFKIEVDGGMPADDCHASVTALAQSRPPPRDPLLTHHASRITDAAQPARSSKSPAAGSSLLSLADFYQLPIRQALPLIEHLASQHRPQPSDPLGMALAEVQSRLRYLLEVGLGYLTLDRPTRSLSGGETERVNLTTCLGTHLVNTLFVLDEPSVGLHPRDTDRLVTILEHLRDAGNTVVTVEHEPRVMRAADQIIDLGPGSGETGGYVVFQGGFTELLKSSVSLTGQYLSGRKQIPIPKRRPVALVVDAHDITSIVSPHLTLKHATMHNLDDLTVEIPLGRLVVISGVSGSGKSTLVRDLLMPALNSRLQSARDARSVDRDHATNSEHDPEDDQTENPESPASLIPTLEGCENLGEVILVDQSSLGKTPRSNPAVYTGAFADLRELYAQTDLARQRGLGPSAFSFNSKIGQCERCHGAGFEKIEMQFLSDVFIRCPDCEGRRYRPHVLEIKLPLKSPALQKQAPTARTKSASNPSGAAGAAALRSARSPDKNGWSIADLLEATVDEVVRELASHPDSRPARRAAESLKLLQEVGLGYLRLGQPINTLSGGECQRLKLVRHLADFALAREADAKPALFLFDEPTTGLHFDDVRLLLQVCQRLVDAGHSLVIIEHNLEIIKCADWLIDLGPEAGDQGGRIVVQGPPEQVAACPASHTGLALKEMGLFKHVYGDKEREAFKNSLGKGPKQGIDRLSG